ncbi:MAG: ABC transporter substrate-binding protein [Deltaproteobacteria bacterium]|nr:ABC transporter substrate-binding protein [Deltaproteobacteria bacterium]
MDHRQSSKILGSCYGFTRLWLKVIILLAIITLAPLSLRAEDRGDARTVYGATHPSTFALYALDPDLLGGWNTLLRAYEKKFIPEKYQSLPILGGWYGAGYTPDPEVLISSGLKKALYLGGAAHDSMGITPVLEELGMEVIIIPSALSEMPETFRALGQKFNRKERGEELAAYAEEVLGKLQTALGDLPEDQKPKIYMALGEDGLESLCRRSDRSDSVVWAGGENIYDCPEQMANANLRLSIEEIMRLDPDVVLVFNADLAKIIEKDPGWSQIRAIREGRWRLVPRGPFSWLERPATYMRLLGMQWLANWLHPELYPLDVDLECRRFLKLFFGLEPSPQELTDLLTR